MKSCHHDEEEVPPVDPNDKEEAIRIERFQRYVERSLIGFCNASGGTASGFLVRVADDVLVATAGHVVTDIRSLADQITMHSFPKIHLPGGHFIFTESRDSWTKMERLVLGADIGFIQLKEETASRLVDYATPLSCLYRNVQLGQLLKENQQLAGFPVEFKNLAQNVQAASFVYGTAVRRPGSHGHSSILPDSRGFYVDWSTPITTSEEILKNWNSSGMSGGPLWSIERTNPNEPKTLEDRVYVAGILFFGDDKRCTSVRIDPIAAWLELVEGVDVREWTEAIATERQYASSPLIRNTSEGPK